jgi:hypothetical protein
MATIIKGQLDVYEVLELMNQRCRHCASTQLVLEDDPEFQGLLRCLQCGRHTPSETHDE